MFGRSYRRTEIFILHPIDAEGNIKPLIEIPEMNGGHDRFSLGDRMQPEIDTRGVAVMTGMARHYSKIQVGEISKDTGWTQGLENETFTVGGNSGRTDEPGFWNDSPAGGEAQHSLILVWCYCNGEEYRKTYVIPEKP